MKISGDKSGININGLTRRVNMLIDNIECVMEGILYGEDITEEQVGYLKTRIAMVRQHEKPFKEMLDIKPSKEKY